MNFPRGSRVMSYFRQSGNGIRLPRPLKIPHTEDASQQ